MVTTVITYEQPVNELIRICLRLEHCFQQAEYYMQGDSVWDTRNVLTAINEILNIIDRPDLKTKLTQECQRHHENLEKLQHSPNIDITKLQHILDNLDTVRSQLHKTAGKFAQKLRENKFLEQIRQQLASGEAYAFDTPAYHCWLAQPVNTRIQQLSSWIKELNLIQTASRLLLQLTRQSNVAKPQTAVAGFYEQTLDSQASWQLIRVLIPTNVSAYPEISVGRHRLCIRMLTPSNNEKATQTDADVNFSLACCML